MRKRSYAKGVLLLAAAPLSLALCGATAGTRALFYKTTPIYVGRKITITWKWHDALRQDFILSYAFLSEGNYMTGGADAFSFADNANDYEGTITIDGDYVKGDGSIILHADYGQYYRSSTRVEILFTAGVTLEEQIREDCSFQPGRTYVSSGYGEGSVKVGQDYFQFRNANETMTYAGLRKVGIKDYRIGYSNQVRPGIKWLGAGLWCLDHLDDFPTGMLRYSNALQRYGRYYPLSITELTDYSGDYGFTYYGLALKEELSYGRAHLNGMNLDEATGLRFPSDELLVPVGYGHDHDTYSFYIELYSWSTSDKFFLHRSVSFDDAHFGPCESADYCVVEG